MKKGIPALITGLGLFSLILILSGCSKIEGPHYTNDQTNYVLNPVVSDKMSGTVTFTRSTDNAVIITIQLAGTAPGSSHPAHLHANTVAQDGPVVLDLNDIDGVTGVSETVVTTLNDQTPVTYEDLLSYSGFINIHVSTGNLETIIAEGDIGINAASQGF